MGGIRTEGSQRRKVAENEGVLAEIFGSEAGRRGPSRAGGIEGVNLS